MISFLADASSIQKENHRLTHTRRAVDLWSSRNVLKTLLSNNSWRRRRCVRSNRSYRDDNMVIRIEAIAHVHVLELVLRAVVLAANRFDLIPKAFILCAESLHLVPAAARTSVTTEPR